MKTPKLMYSFKTQKIIVHLLACIVMKNAR